MNVFLRGRERRSRIAGTRVPGIVVPACTSIALLVLAVAVLHAPTYSPDSWSYIELARSFGHDPLRIVVWRSYAFPEPYTTSFPPLWPGVLAMAWSVTGAGPIVGLLMALAAFAAFCAAAELLGREATGVSWLGLASAVAMGADPSFVDEIAAGRAMPLHMLLLACLLLVLFRGAGGWRSNALLGGMAGLLVMNRFDALPVAAGVLLLGLLRWQSLRGTILAGGVLLLVISPWIAHSWLRFGVPFATDNGPVAASLDQLTYVTDFLPDGQQTLRDNPAAWLAKLQANIAPLLEAQRRGVLDGAWWLGAVALALALPLLTWKLAARHAQAPTDWAPLAWMLLVLLVLLLPSVTYLATGYFDHRYFAPSRWWMLLLAFSLVGMMARTLGLGAMSGAVMALLATTAALTAQGPTAQRALAVGRLLPPPDFADPPLHATLLACLLDAPRARVLFGDAVLATRYGALTGNTALLLPRNFSRLSMSQRRVYVERLGVTHVMSNQWQNGTVFAERYVLESVPCELPLFEVQQGS